MGQPEAQKRRAAEAALALVESQMTLGLGSGSTFTHALTLLAERLASGALPGIRGVPSSEATAERARALSIPLLPLTGASRIDLTIDGADEIDPQYQLIKGGGGALLREKLIAEASERLVIIADESKRVEYLGQFPLPVEVLPFGWERQAHFLADLGAEVKLRLAPSGSSYRTDNGNYILDCAFGRIDDPAALAATIKAQTGIIEHGLFIDLATDVFVAAASGLQAWHRAEAQRFNREPHAKQIELGG